METISSVLNDRCITVGKIAPSFWESKVFRRFLILRVKFRSRYNSRFPKIFQDLSEFSAHSSDVLSEPRFTRDRQHADFANKCAKAAEFNVKAMQIRKMKNTQSQQFEFDFEQHKPVQGAAHIGAKPVIFSDTPLINRKSGFAKKELCDGLTFSPGTSCVFSCWYCYVDDLFGKKPFVQPALKEVNKSFQEVVIRRSFTKEKLAAELKSCGKMTQQSLVIYASPFVDVAATLTLALETAEICLQILQNTAWTIRLLSKSSLIEIIADKIPAEFKTRVIFGLSTGTLNDVLARKVERYASPPSKRLQTLKRLQAKGFRTYAMLCPILPNANSREEFAGAASAFVDEAKKHIDFEACEHIWAEPLNEKGGTFKKVEAGFTAAGRDTESPDDKKVFRQAARSLRLISTKPAWEEYARALFLALSEGLPAGKLRFLQYPIKSTLDWWSAHRDQGAVLLVKNTRRNYGSIVS